MVVVEAISWDFGKEVYNSLLENDEDVREGLWF